MKFVLYARSLRTSKRHHLLQLMGPEMDSGRRHLGMKNTRRPSFKQSAGIIISMSYGGNVLGVSVFDRCGCGETVKTCSPDSEERYEIISYAQLAKGLRTLGSNVNVGGSTVGSTVSKEL